MSSLDSTWTTPKAFFDELDKEFHFTLDAAASLSSAVVPNYFGLDHKNLDYRNALNSNWLEASGGGWVFLNPPYGKEIGQFMNKANEEAKVGTKIVALVPARTDTRWWHDFCIHHKIRFIKGRLKFGDGKNSAPFPSALVIMGSK